MMTKPNDDFDALSVDDIFDDDDLGGDTGQQELTSDVVAHLDVLEDVQEIDDTTSLGGDNLNDIELEEIDLAGLEKPPIAEKGDEDNTDPLVEGEAVSSISLGEKEKKPWLKYSVIGGSSFLILVVIASILMTVLKTESTPKEFKDFSKHKSLDELDRQINLPAKGTPALEAGVGGTPIEKNIDFLSLKEKVNTLSNEAKQNRLGLKLLTAELQKDQRYMGSLKKAIKKVYSDHKELKGSLDFVVGDINKLKEDRAKARTIQAEKAKKQKTQKNVVRSKPKPKVARKSRFSVKASVTDRAYVMKAGSNELIELVVGDRLKGYGKILTITAYGDVITESGPLLKVK